MNDFEFPDKQMIDREWNATFSLRWDSSIAPDPEEVAETRFVSIGELLEAIKLTPESVTRWFLRDIEILLRRSFL